MKQKSQKLTILLVSKVKDIFGIWEVEVLINGKAYTFPVVSEFAVRKIESLFYRHKPGRALKLLKLFTTTGFNSFKEIDNERRVSSSNGAGKDSGDTTEINQTLCSR